MISVLFFKTKITRSMRCQLAEQQSKMFSIMRKNNEAITTWDLPAVQTHLVLCLGGGWGR